MDEKKRSVIIAVDVYCRPLMENITPVYRLYVNDELFAERAWIWQNIYLEENIALHAPPGDYLIRFEVIPSDSAVLKIKNHRIIESQGGIKLLKNLVRITQ